LDQKKKLIIQKGGFLQIILPLITAAIDLFSNLFKKMKQANKFMVVPYEEQKLIKSVEQTPDSKITDIVNNKNLDKKKI
jgi:hypothetical protein